MAGSAIHGKEGGTEEAQTEPLKCQELCTPEQSNAKDGSMEVADSFGLSLEGQILSIDDLMVSDIHTAWMLDSIAQQSTDSSISGNWKHFFLVKY